MCRDTWGARRAWRWLDDEETDRNETKHWQLEAQWLHGQLSPTAHAMMLYDYNAGLAVLGLVGWRGGKAGGLAARGGEQRLSLFDELDSPAITSIHSSCAYVQLCLLY